MAREQGDALVRGKGENEAIGRVGQQVIRHQKLISYAILVSVIVLVTLLVLFRDHLAQLSQLGYLGIFLVNLTGSAALVIPIPGILTVFAGGAVWNPIIVGIVAGLGMTLGETTGWALGYAGQGFVEKHNRFRFLEQWMRKAGGPIIFIGALVPNPFFDLIGVIAGSQKYPLRLFLLWALPGKTLRAIAVAYAGLYGMHWILHLFGGG